MKRLIFLLLVFCGLNAFSDNVPTYTVISGNALSTIADEHFGEFGEPNGCINKTAYLDSIKKWNGLNSNLIRPGDVLVLVNPATYQDNGDSDQETIEETTNDNENNSGDVTLEAETSTSTDGGSLGASPSINSNGHNGNGRDRHPQNTNGMDKVPSEDKDKPKDGSFPWGSLLIGLLLGAVMAIVAYYFFVVKSMKDYYEEKGREANRKHTKLVEEKAEMSREIERLRNKVQAVEKEKQRYFDENVTLGEKVDSLRAELKRERENATAASTAVQTNRVSSQPPAPSFLYADAIIDDYFVKTKETPSDDSIFVLRLEGEDSAVFNVYKQAYQRVVANPSFLEGCEKQILGDTMQLEVVSEGRAQREVSNGKWRVVSKLNVTIK